MNSFTRSTRPTPSLNSTQKKKNILSKILSSANRFFTGKQEKEQKPPTMTREQEIAMAKRSAQRTKMTSLEKLEKINSLNEKKLEQRRF
jgi:hypothetical protein